MSEVRDTIEEFKASRVGHNFRNVVDAVDAKLVALDNFFGVFP